MFKKLANRYAHRPSILRGRGLLVTFASLACAGVVASYGMEWFIREQLQSYGTRLNGAQVSIGKVDLSLWSGRCSLHGVAVTHHVQPMKNLIEIDTVNVRFELFPLLSLKLVIPEIRIQGVSYQTAREESGVVDTLTLDASPTALLDRVAPEAYDKIRASMGKSPLTQLAQLTVGLRVKKAIMNVYDQLQAVTELQAVEKELAQLSRAWEKASTNVLTAPLQAEAEGEIRRIETQRAKLEREAATLLNRLDHIDALVASDLNTVLAELGVPNLSAEEFTKELLGRRTLNHLERLSYWVDLSRRKLPYLPDAQRTLTYTSSLGTEVDFVEPTAKPRLFIERIVIESSAEAGPHRGNIKGLVEHVSTDSRYNKQPLRIQLEADFPGLGIYGLRFTAVVDHRTKTPREAVDLSISAFPLSDWILEESNDLKARITSATASLAVAAEFNDDSISADGTATLTNVSFSIHSRNRQLESTLRDSLSRLSSDISMSGSVSRTDQKTQVSIHSNVGEQLASALGEQFRFPLQAARQSVESELAEQIHPSIVELRKNIVQTKQDYLARLVTLERRLLKSVH